jgi:hypothetical protein
MIPTGLEVIAVIATSSSNGPTRFHPVDTGMLCGVIDVPHIGVLTSLGN